jgi:hypothetical protein
MIENREQAKKKLMIELLKTDQMIKEGEFSPTKRPRTSLSGVDKGSKKLKEF